MASAKTRAKCIRALERDGRFTSQDLVDAARNKKHPMHSDFEWDNEIAGEAHRRSQARGYISAVRVQFNTTTKLVTAIGYVRDPEAGVGPGYVSVVKLKTEYDVAQEALAYEMTRLQAILERTREFAAALELEVEHDLVLNSVRDLASRIRRGRLAGTEAQLSS